LKIQKKMWIDKIFKIFPVVVLSIAFEKKKLVPVKFQNFSGPVPDSEVVVVANVWALEKHFGFCGYCSARSGIPMYRKKGVPC
jgi:hypothetical protein